MYDITNINNQKIKIMAKGIDIVFTINKDDDTTNVFFRGELVGIRLDDQTLGELIEYIYEQYTE